MLPSRIVPSRTERLENVPRDTRAPAEKCPARDILFVARGPDSYRGQPLVKMTGYDIVFWPSVSQSIKNLSPKTGEDDREKYFYLKVCEDTDLGG